MCSVGNNIETFRKRANMTQDVLAEKLNVTKTTVLQWETGVIQPDLSILKCIANVLNIDIEQIVYGDNTVRHNGNVRCLAIFGTLLSIMILLVIFLKPHLSLQAKLHYQVLPYLYFTTFAEPLLYVFAGVTILYFGSLKWSTSKRKLISFAGLGFLILYYALSLAGFFIPSDISSTCSSITLSIANMPWLFLIPGISIPAIAYKKPMQENNKSKAKWFRATGADDLLYLATADKAINVRWRIRCIACDLAQLKKKMQKSTPEELELLVVRTNLESKWLKESVPLLSIFLLFFVASLAALSNSMYREWASTILFTAFIIYTFMFGLLVNIYRKWIKSIVAIQECAKMIIQERQGNAVGSVPSNGLQDEPTNQSGLCSGSCGNIGPEHKGVKKMDNTPNAKKANYNRENFHGYSVQLSQLEDDLGGGWYAYAPELPGCQADGETSDEALEMLKDAIDIFIELATEDQRELPSPRKYSKLGRS